MCLNFYIGYYDEYGNLINSPRAVRNRNLRRWHGFPLDAASIFPIELLAVFLQSNVAYHQLMLFHMLRVIHIKRYLKSLQSKINVKCDDLCSFHHLHYHHRNHRYHHHNFIQRAHISTKYLLNLPKEVINEKLKTNR